MSWSSAGWQEWEKEREETDWPEREKAFKLKELQQ